MDQQFLERFRERSAYETARVEPPDGFPKLPDLPLGRYTDPAFQELEAEHLFKRVWLYAAHESELPTPGSYKLCDIVGAPILLARGRRRRGAGVLQRLPPPRGARRQGHERGGPDARVPVPLVELQPARRARAGAGRAGLRRPAEGGALPARRALRALGRLVLRQPRPRRDPAARVPRPAPPAAARGGGRAVPGHRHQERRARVQLEAPGRGLPRGVPRPDDPPEDRRAVAGHPGHGHHPLRPRPPEHAVAGQRRHTVRQPRAAAGLRGRHRDLPRRRPAGARVLPQPDHAARRPRLPVPRVLAAGHRPHPAGHRLVRGGLGRRSAAGGAPGDLAAPADPLRHGDGRGLREPGADPAVDGVRGPRRAGHQLPGAPHLARPGLDRQGDRPGAHPRAPPRCRTCWTPGSSTRDRARRTAGATSGITSPTSSSSAAAWPA